MKANLCQVGNTQVLAVQDAVSHAECEELREVVLRATNGGVGRVAVDLSEVPFLDGAALEMLLLLSKECLSRGGRLKLACLSPNCEAGVDEAAPGITA